MWIHDLRNFILSVDRAISVYLNGFVHRSWGFDQFLLLAATNPLVKGALVTAAFWYLWFYDRKEPNSQAATDSRATLLSTLLICIPMLVAIRAVAAIIPFRQRPILIPDLHMRLAFGFDTSSLDRWNSFPSDHAAMFFCLATGLFLVSRRVGVLMYVYSTLFIVLPRIIIGVHYTSDAIVGAALGLLVTLLVRTKVVRGLFTNLPFRVLKSAPGAFYAGLFLLTFLTSDLYDSARHMLKVVLQIFGFLHS